MRRLLHEIRTAARLRLSPPASVYVGDHTILARSAWGGFLYLDSRDASLTPHIALLGSWEPGVSRVFNRTVKAGMRVVDIGANCGFFSLLAARNVGPTGHVLAIDANPRMIQLVDRTFEVNTIQAWTRTICGAVSDAEGTLELGIPGEFMGSASVLVKAGDRPEHITTFSAPAKPLDLWMAGDLRADVIKIDCEGAEPLVWTGSRAVRDANRRLTIFMEFAPPMLGEYLAPADFLAQIRQEGFAVSVIDELNGRVSPAADAELLARRWSELVLTRG